MGVLYRGFDAVLDRDVAIKLMLTDFAPAGAQLESRFVREARAIAKLQHRNIVTVFEFSEENATPFMVMEFLRGMSLAARMSEPPPLTVADQLDVVAQLCAGLHYAHSQGIVHRDVKPANVFLVTDGTVKLLDFGIAKVLNSNLTRMGDLLGSAHYMSPEQVAGQTIDARADIFSTGAMLYEMLAGRKPFEADSPGEVLAKILREDPQPLHSLRPALPDRLVETVNRALAKDPAARFSTAGDFERELQLIRLGMAPAATVVVPRAEPAFTADATIVVNRANAAAPELQVQTPPVAAVVAPSQTVPPADVRAPQRRRTWLVAAVAVAVLTLVGTALALGIFSRAASNAGAVTQPPAAVPAVAPPREAPPPMAADSAPAATKTAPSPREKVSTPPRESVPSAESPRRTETATRCARLIERLSLGEELASADGDFFRRNCGR
jgi:eukaryotic-like serine/threonine-protein kinase